MRGVESGGQKGGLQLTVLLCGTGPCDCVPSNNVSFYSVCWPDPFGSLWVRLGSVAADVCGTGGSDVVGSSHAVC